MCWGREKRCVSVEKRVKRSQFWVTGKSCRVGTNFTGRRNFYQKGVPAPKTVQW
jgi:hypothetical protein